jgi:hypothetical protein
MKKTETNIFKNTAEKTGKLPTAKTWKIANIENRSM